MRTGVEHRVGITRVLALVVLAAVAVVAALWLGAKPAEAAFPGSNGRIAFDSDRDGDGEIYTMEPDGTSVRKLTNNSVDDLYASYSADGRKIAFTSRRSDTGLDVYVMNSDGTDQRRITSNHDNDSQPVFSPDGTKIVFVRGYLHSDIYVMNADGTNQRPLTNGTGYDSQPTVSPDGSKIAFKSDPEHANSEIYTMNFNGTNQQRLTNNPSNDTRPNFSPASTKIVFQSRRSGESQIYSMDANGFNQRRISYSNIYETSPSYSPDGEKIVFATTRTGDIEISTIDADGSDRRYLTNNLAEDENPDWQPRSSITLPPIIGFCLIRDCTEPTISSLRPAAGSAIRDRTPTIKATVRDNRTNLAKANIKLYVDGRRKTIFSYNRSTDRLAYTTGRLAPRRHTVKVVAKDAAGNVATKNWRFRVRR